MPEERRAVHCYLTVSAHDTWHTLAEETGISLSGLFEALAADIKNYPPDEGGHPRWNGPDGIVKAARRIDAKRRRRGGS